MARSRSRLISVNAHDEVGGDRRLLRIGSDFTDNFAMSRNLSHNALPSGTGDVFVSKFVMDFNRRITDGIKHEVIKRHASALGLPEGGGSSDGDFYFGGSPSPRDNKRPEDMDMSKSN